MVADETLTGLWQRGAFRAFPRANRSGELRLPGALHIAYLPTICTADHQSAHCPALTVSVSQPLMLLFAITLNVLV
jgi:hypothetical protein